MVKKKIKNQSTTYYKHSTRIGISRMEINQFVSAYNADINADLHYLDLLSYRNVSNEVGFKYQAIHQSPQLLVMRNGTVVALLLMVL